MDSKVLGILVVESYDDYRCVLAVLLETMGHTVWTASNAEDAIEIAKTSTLDLVLAELGVAKGGVQELARQLRQNSCSDELTLVAMSAYDKWSVEAAALKAGFDYFLAKPVTGKHFAAVLKKTETMTARKHQLGYQ